MLIALIVLPPILLVASDALRSPTPNNGVEAYGFVGAIFWVVMVIAVAVALALIRLGSVTIRRLMRTRS